MDKFSELKAAALAATPGPWILDDDSWSDGDNANVSTEERYDGRIISIAQIEGGGSESGFDEPFSAEQQANARYITAANPAVVLALLAELEAKDKRIAELEGDKRQLNEIINTEANRADAAEKQLVYSRDAMATWERKAISNFEECAKMSQRIEELKKRLATPVRLLGEMLVHDWEYSVKRQAAFEHRKTAWDARLAEDKKAISAAGFTFTVEGDEQ
ncbi:ead/Ea22-like family protein [Serratia marcescens]|uniref:Ead/Ea22-like family protein n=1 Tax=Serratia marcescens TaxID=615 RepID=A0ABD5IEP0_SERMA|nr:ead/Ea22-like family protein [Serratia marcescens]MDX7082521.1 ead/Ea22-like family protein [Serratia marcescens]